MKPERLGLLLAGGRSVRMGQDKAFLLWRGMPLWQSSAERLHDAGVRRWVLSCRKEQGLAEQVAAWSVAKGMTLEVAYDPANESGGMVEALVNGLRMAGGQTVVLSVDMPLVTEALINRLWETVGGTDEGCLLMGSRGPEPFPGLYVPSMISELRAGKALRAGLERCLEVGSARALKITAEFEACLANWNFPEDVLQSSL